MKKIIIIFAVALSVASCKKLSDLNVDTKNAENGKAPSETLFANGTRNLVDQVSTPSVNLNIFRTVVQYWTETTYTDESNFNITTRKIPDFEFQAIYRDALSDLNEAKKLVEKETDAVAPAAQRKNKMAVIELLTVYAFQREVDIFGNIPYSEALDINNVLPKYDDAQGIYASLFKRLDDAIKSIDVSVGGFPATYDVIYKSDMAKWKAFGNSLKLKMAITVADVPALNPQIRAEEAYNGGVFTAATQSAQYTYLSASPNTHPIWVQLVSSGRKDWVAANTFVDMLKAKNDPRIDNYLEQNLGAGVYTGGVFGASNKYANYSQVTKTIQSPTWKGNLLDYSEVQFYLAEAAARGYNVGKSAEQYYNEAITSSIIFWGGTALEATTYLAQPNVSYASPLSGADYKEKIGTQAWLAYYDRPDAAWNTYRRLDYPVMAKAFKSKESVPTRYTYPINEQTLNGGSYTAAASAIGGDFKSTKLFWDKF